VKIASRYSRRRLWLGLGLLAGLLLVSCGGTSQAPTTAPARPTTSAAAPTAPAAASPGPSPAAGVTPVSATVKAGSIFALTDSALFLAIERGYIQEAGITLDLQQFDTIVNMIPLLSTGQLDVAFDGASSAGFFNAIARGIEIKMVANEGVASGSATEDRTYYGLVASKSLVDSGQVRSAADR